MEKIVIFIFCLVSAVVIVGLLFALAQLNIFIPILSVLIALIFYETFCPKKTNKSK